MTNAELMNIWGANPTEFEAKLHGSFKMWGDYLNGKITKIDAPNLLVEDWSVDGMIVPSKVVFKLSSKDLVTTIKLEHSNIPDELAEELSDGWDEYYMGKIKIYLEK